MLADDEAEAEAEASSESFSRSESVTTAIRPERRAQFGHRGERQGDAPSDREGGRGLDG